MKWETNGELARGDLFELIRRLRDVESPNHSNELWRLGAKYDKQGLIPYLPLAQQAQLPHRLLNDPKGMSRRTPHWVNSPVLMEALLRYEQNRLPRSMRLWVEQLLEISPEDKVNLQPHHY